MAFESGKTRILWWIVGMDRGFLVRTVLGVNLFLSFGGSMLR
jgi:hypothetical protein